MAHDGVKRPQVFCSHTCACRAHNRRIVGKPISDFEFYAAFVASRTRDVPPEKGILDGPME